MMTIFIHKYFNKVKNKTFLKGPTFPNKKIIISCFQFQMFSTKKSVEKADSKGVCDDIKLLNSEDDIDPTILAEYENIIIPPSNLDDYEMIPEDDTRRRAEEEIREEEKILKWDMATENNPDRIEKYAKAVQKKKERDLLSEKISRYMANKDDTVNPNKPKWRRNFSTVGEGKNYTKPNTTTKQQGYQRTSTKSTLEQQKPNTTTKQQGYQRTSTKSALEQQKPNTTTKQQGYQRTSTKSALEQQKPNTSSYKQIKSKGWSSNTKFSQKFTPKPKLSRAERVRRSYIRRKSRWSLHKLLKRIKQRPRKIRPRKQKRFLFFKHLPKLKRTNVLTLIWSSNTKLKLIQRKLKIKKRYTLTKYFKLKKNKKKRKKHLFIHFFYRQYYYFYFLSQLLLTKKKRRFFSGTTYHFQTKKRTYQTLLNKFWDLTTIAMQPKQKVFRKKKSISTCFKQILKRIETKKSFFTHLTYYYQTKLKLKTPKLNKFQFLFFFNFKLKKQVQKLLRVKMQFRYKKIQNKKFLKVIKKFKKHKKRTQFKNRTLFLALTPQSSPVCLRRDKKNRKRIRYGITWKFKLAKKELRTILKERKRKYRSHMKYIVRRTKRELRRAKRILKRKRRTTRRKKKIRGKKYNSILLLKKLNNIHLKYLMKKKLVATYNPTKLTRPFLKKFSNAFHTYLHVTNVQFFFRFRLFQMMNRQFRKNRIFFYKVTNSFKKLKTLTSIKKIVHLNLNQISTLDLKLLAAKRFNRRVFYKSLKQRYYTRRFFSNHELLPLMLNCFFKRTSTYYLLAFIGLLLKKFKKHYGVLTHINRFFIYFFKLTNSHAPIKGLKYIIRGRVNGAPRKKNKIYSFGSIRNNTLKTTLDYTQLSRETRYGTFGLRMWRYF